MGYGHRSSGKRSPPPLYLLKPRIFPLQTIFTFYLILGSLDDTDPRPTCIVTLECAAVLPNSEAEDVVKHIEAVWERGKLAIDALRECLGPELRDTLCPLRNGGVSLHKLYGVMHDTCNCANKVWHFWYSVAKIYSR